MKKIIMTICAAVAMFTIVSCGNPAIKAGEKLIDNPTPENYVAFIREGFDLSEAEFKEFEEWTEENGIELWNAVLKAKMGKTFDEAAEEMGESMEKAAEEMGESMEKAAEEMGKAAEEMGKAFE